MNRKLTRNRLGVIVDDDIGEEPMKAAKMKIVSTHCGKVL